MCWTSSGPRRSSGRERPCSMARPSPARRRWLWHRHERAQLRRVDTQRSIWSVGSMNPQRRCDCATTHMCGHVEKRAVMYRACDARMSQHLSPGTSRLRVSVCPIPYVGCAACVMQHVLACVHRRPRSPGIAASGLTCTRATTCRARAVCACPNMCLPMPLVRPDLCVRIHVPRVQFV